MHDNDAGRLVCDLSEPIARGISSARIVPVCLDVTADHVVVGASSGSLYVFMRRTMARLELVSHPDVTSAVSCVKVSPDGKYAAFAGSGAGAAFVIARIACGTAEQRSVYSAPCAGTGSLVCLE